MSTTRKIAHNTLYQLIGKIISVTLGLIALGMMTRYLGQEQFGWYVTTIAFLQFIGILIDFGLIPVTAQMMSEPAFDKEKLFKNLIGFRFTTAVLFLGAAPLIALLFPYPTEVKIAIAFSTVSFLSIAMNQVLVGFYQTKLKMHIQAIGEVVGRIVLVLGLWFLMARGEGFIPIMIVIALSSIAYTIVLWTRASKETPVSFGFNKEIWKAIAIKMWPIAISIMFNVLYLKGDILILSWFREQTEIGLYGAAYRVIDILSQTALMIMGVMLPLLAYNWSRNLKAEFQKLYQQSFDAMMALAFPALIGTLLLANKVMLLVAGSEFQESGKTLQILALAIFGLYLGAIFGHAAVAINKQKQVMWIYISAAVLTVIGYFIFIPTYGMYGAAWMTVFSEIYTGTLLFAAVSHYSKIRLQTKALAKIFFSSIVMGAILLSFSHLHVLILVPLGILVYGFFLFSLGAVSKETMREIIKFK
ncbi:MAG: flippase [Candidatus Magasanikbacteria bacterium]